MATSTTLSMLRDNGWCANRAPAFLDYLNRVDAALRDITGTDLALDDVDHDCAVAFEDSLSSRSYALEIAADYGYAQ